MEPYAVVHLVVGESMKDLVETQVIDHMRWQTDTNGTFRPVRVIVALLEPARVAAKRAVRKRIRDLQSRAPEVKVVLLPFMSRLGVARNARLLAPRLRRLAGVDSVVLHCRGESAVPWADEFRKTWPRSGVVFDVRGAVPEEVLYERGFDGPTSASAEALRTYHANFAILHNALARSESLLCVSESLKQWLTQLGVSPSTVHRVPCCVSSVPYTAEHRARARRELGLEKSIVITYLGSVTKYQHVEDAVIPFFSLALAAEPAAHLLCLTSHEQQMSQMIERAGIPKKAYTVSRVPQRQVPDYLMAADAGILLRETTRMNRVSMPVKFAEYLSCGVPVIATRVVGWIDDIVERSGAGLVIDWFGASPDQQRAEAERVCRALRTDGERMRSAALDLCRNEFLWKEYVAEVRSAYAEALR